MKLFLIILALLSAFVLSACGSSGQPLIKEQIDHCEKIDDFVGPYPEKILCTTVSGNEYQLDLERMFSGYGITYFLEFSPMTFFDLSGDSESSYLVSVRGCNSGHRCSVLYKPGDQILIYTKELTY